MFKHYMHYYHMTILARSQGQTHYHGGHEILNCGRGLPGLQNYGFNFFSVRCVEVQKYRIFLKYC